MPLEISPRHDHGVTAAPAARGTAAVGQVFELGRKT
jgi:hypothetical protein